MWKKFFLCCFNLLVNSCSKYIYVFRFISSVANYWPLSFSNLFVLRSHFTTLILRLLVREVKFMRVCDFACCCTIFFGAYILKFLFKCHWTEIFLTDIVYLEIHCLVVRVIFEKIKTLCQLIFFCALKWFYCWRFLV